MGRAGRKAARDGAADVTEAVLERSEVCSTFSYFLITAWVATAAGRTLLRGLRLPEDATRLERNLFGFALGLGLLAYGMLALGLLHGLYPLAGWLLVAAAGCCWAARRIAAMARELRDALRGGIRLTPLGLGGRRAVRPAGRHPADRRVDAADADAGMGQPFVPSGRPEDLFAGASHLLAALGKPFQFCLHGGDVVSVRADGRRRPAGETVPFRLRRRARAWPCMPLAGGI